MYKAFALVRAGLFWLAMGLMVLCLLAGIFAPRTLGDHLPFRFYTILTDSMSPDIPPMSLVLVRQISPQTPLALEPEQIITFRAERFGQEIIQTHHFSHTEWDEELGQVIYRTHPQQTTNLDFYKTTREDILGVYVFSVPWLGKLLLFLKSPWGLMLLGEELLIYLLNRLIRARWAERETPQPVTAALCPAEQ